MKEKIKKSVRIPLDQLLDNPDNPNEMSEKELAKLCENILEIGFVEPLLVVKVEEGFEIVAGHHRAKAARQLGWEEVPCVVYEEEEWDKTKRDMQMMRMNIIKGKISPNKFVDLFRRYADEYGDKVVQEMMGFASEEALQEILKQVKKGMPKRMANELDAAMAAGEISSIGELESIISKLFAEYGHTIPLNFMFFVCGDKKHVMQKTDPKFWKRLRAFYDDIERNELDSLEVFKKLLDGAEKVLEEAIADKVKDMMK